MAESVSKYIDAKALEKIKRLDLRARLVVEGFLTGQHQSPYHGFAVEFAAHREYVPGDDLRHIDWKVWSKTDRLYIKEYEEETNLKCNIIVDCSKSMRYGEKSGWSKFDYSATAAAALAFFLQQQQDSVGLVTFSNKIDKNIKASGGPNHLKLLLHELESTQPDNTTEVSKVFLELGGLFRQRGLIVLFSDLLISPDLVKEALSRFRFRGHEVVVFHVLHEHELTFPFDDNTMFKGLETDVQLFTEPRSLRKAYLETLEKYLAEVRKVCAGLGVDHVLMDTSQPLDAVLSRYLSFRTKTRRKLRRK